MRVSGDVSSFNMKISIDNYTLPCACGGAIDANGCVVLYDEHPAGNDPPLFEEVMAILNVAG